MLRFSKSPGILATPVAEFVPVVGSEIVADSNKMKVFQPQGLCGTETAVRKLTFHEMPTSSTFVAITPAKSSVQTRWSHQSFCKGRSLPGWFWNWYGSLEAPAG